MYYVIHNSLRTDLVFSVLALSACLVSINKEIDLVLPEFIFWDIND